MASWRERGLVRDDRREQDLDREGTRHGSQPRNGEWDEGGRGKDSQRFVSSIVWTTPVSLGLKIIFVWQSDAF